jgi:hypothetical protein
MSVVDYLLNSLITRLKKTQKARKRRKKSKRKPAKKARKPIKKKKVFHKRKKASRKRSTVKRFIKKAFNVKKKKSAVKTKKKPSVKKKKNRLFFGKKKTASRSKLKPKITKPAKKVVAKIPAGKVPSQEACVGEITHFFSRIQVVVLKMTRGSLSVGDYIRIFGKGADFTQKVGSLQIESVDVKSAHKGQLVGLKVHKAVKVGSRVYKETDKS